MTFLSPAIEHNDLVGGLDEIVERLRAQGLPEEAIAGWRIQSEIGLSWMLSLKVTTKIKPSRKTAVRLLKPLGVYYASLYELCRQRVGVRASNLFLACLYDAATMPPHLDHIASKAKAAKAKTGAIKFLKDEVAGLEPIAYEASPLLWLMQQSASEADLHDQWGKRYWFCAQKKKFAYDNTPFLNAWAAWLRHSEREPGLALTTLDGDRLKFVGRGGRKKAVFAKTDA